MTSCVWPVFFVHYLNREAFSLPFASGAQGVELMEDHVKPALFAVLREYHHQLTYNVTNIEEDEPLRQYLQAAANEIQRAMHHLEGEKGSKSAASSSRAWSALLSA